MSKKIKLDFSVSFSEVVNLNPNFSMAKMKVAYVGRNRNMSAISKEVFIDAIPTIFNCPIVARYDRELNQFGSHDVEVVIDDKTKEIKIVNATTPFGVIPESAKWYFEEITEIDGNIHEYLIIDVILWRRQEGYEHLVELTSIDESMEVDFINQHIDNEGYCVAEKMCFSAFCLLETANPCFESASVQMFSEQINDNYKLQFANMVEDFKALMKEQSNKLDFSINIIKEEGGQKTLILTQEKITEILAEYEILQNDIDFEITEEMTEGDFRTKLEDFKKKRKKCTEENSNQEPETDEEKELLKTQIEQAREEYANLQEEFTTYKSNYSVANDEVANLKEFKATRLSEDHKLEVKLALSEFEDLIEINEFIELKENAENFESIDDLKEKCFAIRGKNTPVKFSTKLNKPTSIKLPIGIPSDNSDDEPYGGIFNEFGKRK